MGADDDEDNKDDVPAGFNGFVFEVVTLSLLHLTIGELVVEEVVLFIVIAEEEDVVEIAGDGAVDSTIDDNDAKGSLCKLDIYVVLLMDGDLFGDDTVTRFEPDEDKDEKFVDDEDDELDDVDDEEEV